jgi:hypothetical protein
MDKTKLEEGCGRLEAKIRKNDVPEVMNIITYLDDKIPNSKITVDYYDEVNKEKYNRVEIHVRASKKSIDNFIRDTNYLLCEDPENRCSRENPIKFPVKGTEYLVTPIHFSYDNYINSFKLKEKLFTPRTKVEVIYSTYGPTIGQMRKSNNIFKRHHGEILYQAELERKRIEKETGKTPEFVGVKVGKGPMSGVVVSFNSKPQECFN